MLLSNFYRLFLNKPHYIFKVFFLIFKGYFPFRVIYVCCCLATRSCTTVYGSMDCSLPDLLMRYPKQEYWSVLPFPSPRDLPDLGIESISPALAGRFFTIEPLGKPCSYIYVCVYTYICMCCAVRSCPVVSNSLSQLQGL